MSVVEFVDVAKRYRRGRERINLRAAIPGRLGEVLTGDAHWAIDGLSFSVGAGGSLAFVGPNGAGKSTVLKLVARVVAPTRGSVRVRGRAASLIELGAGFHPDMTGRENIYFGASVLGMGPRTLARRFDEVVDFADVGDYLDTPVKRYSSGMLARLGFAVASHLDAEILVLDEVLAVGDADFQRKCHARIAELRRAGAALLYVTHAMWTVPLLCDEAVLLVDGRPMATGPSVDVVRTYERLQHAGAMPVIGTEAGPIRSVAITTGAIVPGGAVALDIELELPADHPDGHVLVVLADPQERVIAATSSSELGGLRAGRCLLRCDLGELPLQPGSYLVHVGYLADRRRPAVDELRTVPLEVEGDPPEAGYGPLRLSGGWSSVERGAAPGHT